MLPRAIQQFITLYESLEKDQLQRLKEIYSPAIRFVDPMQHLEGIDALQNHFTKLYQNIHYCRFKIQEVCSQEQQAFLTWDMNYAHPRLNAGKAIQVQGASHLRFDTLITYHRDYVDLGQMLYEHIPLVGGVIRTLKQRASA